MPKSVRPISCQNCQCIDRGVFCDLEYESRLNLTSNKMTGHYKRGQTIFLEGNAASGIYCINSGKLKITKSAGDGKESIVRIVGPGDIMGHHNIFSGESHSVTATVIEDAAICFIDKPFIMKLISERSDVALNIIQKMAKEMGAVESRNAGMPHRSVKERLAELLLNLRAAYGIIEGSRIRLDVRLTREEMASMIGTASETIIRFISEFKDEGIIEQEGKIIFISDEEGLIKTANFRAS